MDPTLPAFIQPILEFLSQNLPQPVYFMTLNILSHSLAFFTASTRLFTSLISKETPEWHAQALLPPIISLLVAYLALASLYRTTTWMLKTGVWVLKWAIILGALGAGAGWLAAVTSMNGVGAPGVLSGLGSVISNWIDGGSTTPSRSKTKLQKGQKMSKQRTYKPWDSFQQIRDWQYQESQNAEDDMTETQKIMQNIVENANQVFDSAVWWHMAKVMVGAQGPDDADVQKANKRTSRTRTR